MGGKAICPGQRKKGGGKEPSLGGGGGREGSKKNRRNKRPKGERPYAEFVRKGIVSSCLAIEVQ